MINFQELTRLAQHLHALAPEVFAPLTDDESLRVATAALRGMDQEMGEDAGHPLRPLADTLAQRIVTYEAEHHPVPDADGAEMLAFMLEQRGLSQRELAAATRIPQSTLSNLISRKRAFTAAHARALADYFGGSTDSWL